MSDIVTLSLKAPIEAGGLSLDVHGVTGDAMAGLTALDIARLPVWLGAREVRLGDFFTIRGEHSSRVRVEGDLGNVDGLGADMSGGELVIEGDAGCRVAAGMTGGSVEVRGDVGDDAGMAMAGGILRIGRNAGHRLGAALPGASRGMTGGEIIVSGAAGPGAAACLRRGLIVVMNDVGDEAARAMLAGTLITFGRTGADAGRGNRRGSIVACGSIAIPPTYTYACTYEPPHLRLTMTYLRRRHRLAIDESVVVGRYRRYCGDAGAPVRGEILQWVTG